MSRRRLGQAALGGAVLAWLALGAADEAEPPAQPPSVLPCPEG